MNKCQVTTGITQESPYKGYREICTENSKYIVTSKDEPHFVFLCCDKHTNLFPINKWDFKRI